MIKLDTYAMRALGRDRDCTWNWSKNGATILHSGRAGADALCQKLLKEEQNFQLLPVTGWYTKPESESIAKHMCNLLVGGAPYHDMAKDMAKKYRIAINDSVFKLNWTNSTANAQPIHLPSVFISPENGKHSIREGDKFLLLDDTYSTGGTLRDLIRHINNRGGKVLGTVITDSSTDTISDSLFNAGGLRNSMDKMMAYLWALRCKNIFANSFNLLEKWNSLKAEEKTTFAASAKEVANSHLRKCAMNLDQLTTGEVIWLNQELGGSVLKLGSSARHVSEEDFWKAQTDHAILMWLPGNIERPAELAKKLGVECQKEWAKRAAREVGKRTIP